MGVGPGTVSLAGFEAGLEQAAAKNAVIRIATVLVMSAFLLASRANCNPRSDGCNLKSFLPLFLKDSMSSTRTHTIAIIAGDGIGKEVVPAGLAAIEAALDINAHLIAEHGAAVPDDYYGGFLALAKLQVLPEALARDLAPSAGLRNRLVHEYETLDDAKVLAAIEDVLALYAEFVEAIEGHLRRSGF